MAINYSLLVTEILDSGPSVDVSIDVTVKSTESYIIVSPLDPTL